MTCVQCEREPCNNGDDCWYYRNEGCNFCHCEEVTSDDFDNGYSVEIQIHNINREQGHAAIDAVAEAVEDKRQDGQPRHDGHAILDKTDNLLSQGANKKQLSAGEEDED